MAKSRKIGIGEVYNLVAMGDQVVNGKVVHCDDLDDASIVDQVVRHIHAAERGAKVVDGKAERVTRSARILLVSEGRVLSEASCDNMSTSREAAARPLELACLRAGQAFERVTFSEGTGCWSAKFAARVQAENFTSPLAVEVLITGDSPADLERLLGLKRPPAPAKKRARKAPRKPRKTARK